MVIFRLLRSVEISFGTGIIGIDVRLSQQGGEKHFVPTQGLRDSGTRPPLIFVYSTSVRWDILSALSVRSR